MINKTKNRVKIIRDYVKKVPYFKLNNLLLIDNDRSYLRILLSRMSKAGEIIRIKRGMYVHRDYFVNIQIKNELDEYYEFLACSIFEDAYLSLEYVLSEYGVLSESVYGYSLISNKKPYKIKNEFGFFSNHSIKDKLLLGYLLVKKNNFFIKKASVAKALFDFLYLRKNILVNKESVDALRLNLEVLTSKDKFEFKKYIKLEGSKKMLKIYNYLNI